ncbi:hypothetical protein FACS1894124_6830 [Spirochaetia bacterium]|nr:hypothetical protein FACS1894124_6830 [Spirochaetia bacterium]
MPQNLTSGWISISIKTRQYADDFVPFVAEPSPKYLEDIQYAEAVPGVRYRVPTAEAMKARLEKLAKDAPHVCTSLEEALQESAKRAKAEAADPSPLKKWHGVLENSKAWGKNVDVATEIRTMRDEWGDPWGDSPLQMNG